jgi:nicotinamidase/pyrazinamidase
LPNRALIIVDVQNDFLPGGRLPVPFGDEVIDVANRVVSYFDEVVTTQDWHPPNHVSFAVNHPGHEVGDVIDVAGDLQTLWPVHCVQNTWGAALASGLDARSVTHVIHKGTYPDVDSYSAFFDNAKVDRRATGLVDYLQSAGAKDLYFLGLATNFCVAASARDALDLGFKVSILVDGCRGIDVPSQNSAAALAELRERGARLLKSEDLPAWPAA